VASSKKTVPSKSRPEKGKVADAETEDAGVTDAQTPVTAPEDLINDPVDSQTEDQIPEKTEGQIAGTEAPDESAAADSPAPADQESTPEQALEQTAEMPEDPITPVGPEPTAAASEPQKGSSFLPMVLGGIIAAGMGFGVAQLGLLDPEGAELAAQMSSDLSAQQERIAVLEAAETVVPEVDLSAVEAQIDGIGTQLEGLEARLAAFEDRPAAAVPEGVDASAYAEELEALKSSVDAQRGEIEALLSNARSVEQATADAARAAQAQTALARIVSALDTGQPFVDAVSELQALDLGDLDPGLASVAADGVTTLSILQAQFPDSARAALAAARAGSAGEGQQGLGGFLTRSLGARSVTPREGDDPDAVLSRAEAALNAGDLTAALTELDALPEDAKAAIAEWRAAANARADARAAADALAQRLTAD